MQEYKLITLTHKNANLNQIGKLLIASDSPAQLTNKLHEIKQGFGFTELIYLATCNRITFFFITPQVIDTKFVAKLFLNIGNNISESEAATLSDLAQVYEGENALRHIFEVASSVDSLVIGEREILRQLRAAYESCKEAGLAGDNLRIAMRCTVQTAKQVYSETKIGEKPVSVVSLAGMELLRLHVSREAKFLIIGAGQTINLMAKFLLKHGFKNFVLFNRTAANAATLAKRLNAGAFPLSELQNKEADFDVLITCTGATEPVITEALYSKLIKQDISKKTILDLAVPNDVERSVIENYNVHYIEIEKLREEAQKNLAYRKEEITLANVIIENSLKQFKTTYRQRQVERSMNEIPARVKEIKEMAVNTVFSKDIATLDENGKLVLDKILNYMEKKYISIPMKAAKASVSDSI